MSRALKSAFFRFFRTGLWIKIMIFSVVLGLFVIFQTCSSDLMLYMFKRPRFLSNSFVMTCILKLVYIMPFATAIFSAMFTGNDISFRTINNKISTGISRVYIYLADLIVTVLSSLFSLFIMTGIFFLFAKFVPVKSDVRISSFLFGIFSQVLVISLAFASLYTLLQFFLSTKLLALIVSLLMIPCLMFGTIFIQSQLDEPYRYSYVDEETGEVAWKENPDYVGGTARKIFTFISETSPYSYEFIVNENSFPQEAIAAGTIFALSSAAGLIAIGKKEYQ
ncbi:ABC transporter permease [Butyrivibrio sp. AE2032]|jgi:hypothetical protein|uniref:ABC transporter permease n=1 Tax=Butyrivibrio sp. AE2032 TaxID=1458463 RepID=UPI00054F4551|nr:ABC transporter permease [Butyrivibrio sp. AE2032]